jgi:multidrug efflux pump subunit AcrA (membrane-fusion protein)
MQDTTTGTQDSQLNAKAPGAEGNAPQEATFTKAQLEEAIQKDRIARGRDEKAFSDRESKLKEREDYYARLQREQEEKEDESARKNGTIADLQAKRKADEERRKINEDRATLDAEKAAHAEKIKKAEEHEHENMILRAATTSGIDPATLKSDCAEFGFTTEAQITRYAEKLKGTAAKPPLHVDSNKGSGGNTKIGDLPPKERTKAADALLRKK